ncbi:FtsX-like permease family protein [Streptomyces luteogriseus]|uniref:FtsX-like permease family protein n=1 Tax=Streptomyces luteogriseus TaxID=68233 RepID=UPI0036E87B88
MAAFLGGFAAVNTLGMTVLDRRGELGTVRLLGSTRRQVLHMARREALPVATAVLVPGTAAATLPARAALRGETLER